MLGPQGGLHRRAALERRLDPFSFTDARWLVWSSSAARGVVARLTAANGAEAHRNMYRRAAARLTDEDIPADEPLTRIKARLGL